jgi:hypothetical protein
MQFGRVKIGDHYSVSPMATLGPTQEKTRGKEERAEAEKTSSREIISEQEQRAEKRATKKRLASLES